MARLRVVPRTLRGKVILVGCVAGGIAGTAYIHAHPRYAADVAGKPLRTFTTAGFSVSLPYTPKPDSRSATTALGPVTFTSWACVGGKDFFLLGTSHLPPKATFDLRSAANGAASEVGGTATDLSETTYQGHPAVDFRVPGAVKNAKKATLFERIVDAGTVVYYLQYLEAGADVVAPPASYPNFLASLHID